MYELGSDSPQAERCKEPDWELEIKKAHEALEKISNFHAALKDFIFTVGHNYSSRRGERNYLAELLGTVEIDIMQRNREIERLMKNLEEK